MPRPAHKRTRSPASKLIGQRRQQITSDTGKISRSLVLVDSLGLRRVVVRTRKVAMEGPRRSKSWKKMYLVTLEVGRSKDIAPRMAPTTTMLVVEG